MVCSWNAANTWIIDFFCRNKIFMFQLPTPRNKLIFFFEILHYSTSVFSFLGFSTLSIVPRTLWMEFANSWIRTFLNLIRIKIKIFNCQIKVIQVISQFLQFTYCFNHSFSINGGNFFHTYKKLSITMRIGIKDACVNANT